MFESLSEWSEQAENRTATVLTTAELQWPRDAEKAAAVTHAFEVRHFKYWDELFLDSWASHLSQHIPNFDEYHTAVLTHSPKGSEWHDLMMKAYEELKKVNTTWEESLEYQRAEYAAVVAWAVLGYRGFVYLGHFSEALLHTQKIFGLKDFEFIKAEVKSITPSPFPTGLNTSKHITTTTPAMQTLMLRLRSSLDTESSRQNCH
jgi:hypothetical protein